MLWLSDVNARAFILYSLSENTQNESGPKRRVSMNSIRRIRNCTSHFIVNLWCERRQRGTQDWGSGRSASSRTGNVLVTWICKVNVDKDRMSSFSSILWSLIKSLVLGCLLQTQVFSDNYTRKLGREGHPSSILHQEPEHSSGTGMSHLQSLQLADMAEKSCLTGLKASVPVVFLDISEMENWA